jgi:hypothetical protein
VSWRDSEGSSEKSRADRIYPRGISFTFHGAPHSGIYASLRQAGCTGLILCDQ